MASFKVVTVAQYLTRSGSPWRDEDYTSSAFIKAIKGEPVNGYHNFTVCGHPKHLVQANVHEAFGWAAEMLGKAMKAHGMKFGYLVPMPSSNTTVAGPRVLAGAHKLATAISTLWPDEFHVRDLLSFNQVMIPTRKGGPRDPATLHAAMEFREAQEIAAGIPIYIVDDVLTSGAHFQAACRHCEENGLVIHGGAAVGRSTQIQEEEPWAIGVSEYDRFIPGIPF